MDHIIEIVCVLLLGGVFWSSLLLPNNIDSRPQLHYCLILLAFAVLLSVSWLSLEGESFFSRYILALCYFHLSEFFLVSFPTGKYNFNSFLLNHGVHYAGAFTLSAIEHFACPYHYPEAIQSVGLVTAIVGLGIRGISLLTAGEAFTHLIAFKKSKNHRLVTHGIYSWMRHPGYCGWLIWVTSSQVMAGNMISSITFFLGSLYFFKERIEYEESLLTQFFGNEYIQYRARVPCSGVPFINS